jgi:PQQ-dependent dehydrogenase (methanol/ethanol family)
MIRIHHLAALGVLAGIASVAAHGVAAQEEKFTPVTQQMLENPSPNDWLMFSRTYDAQRFSPLDQINKENVGQLRMVWTRGLPEGTQETIPLVYEGVLYSVLPGAGVLALDATNGDAVWEYLRDMPRDMGDYTVAAGSARAKNLAIFEDMIYYTAPDGFVVALDARTGEVRWETAAHDYRKGAQHASGIMVAEGKVISARACRFAETREDGCFLVAHDARTGEEVWKFYNTAAPGEPGGDSWGDMEVSQRKASAWGLAGSYDPEKRLVYWGIANPFPYTRLNRHNGNPNAISNASPAEAYTNSTVALNPDTGELVWYYQELPGDDWDLDHVHEKFLIRTEVNPDPDAVKWISSEIQPGEERDIVLTVAEGGGVWAIDGASGEFLWATPFPIDTPDFHISNIDVKTGQTFINMDKVFKQDGDRVLVCSFNTRGYWPPAYHPGNNSLYIPFHDSCLDMTANRENILGAGRRVGIPRPGIDLDAFTGLAKMDVATGRWDRIYTARTPSNGAVLATAGDLIFWGDVDRRFRAFDADDGKILWETIVGGVVQMSTVTYAVDGKQYILVMTGSGQSATNGVERQVPGMTLIRENAIYAFALP